MLTALATLLPGAAAEAKPRFGVHVNSEQQTTPAEWDRMALGKVGVVRRSFSYTTNEAAYDALMAQTSAVGLSVLPVVMGSSAAPPRSRDARDAYNRFLKNLVERYGRNGTFWDANPGLPYRPIKDWQIWNEPSLDVFWGGDPDPREYAKLVEGARKAVESRDELGDVILAGLPYDHEHGMSLLGYLKKLYDVKGIEKHFDAVAVHAYGRDEDDVKFILEQLRSRLKSVGDKGREIWITEMGWATQGSKDSPFVKSESGQARLLRKTFALLRDERKRYDLDTVVWYNWQDLRRDFAQEGGPFHDYIGLFDANGDPKPSWQEFTSFTDGDSGGETSLSTGGSTAPKLPAPEDVLDGPGGGDVLPPPADGSSGR